jgi:LDH2 family malate/lactate/ureidoglycolate dehydrogenase
MNRRDVIALCQTALEAAGADRRVAELLTEAALFAEDRGKAVVGVAHLLDYIGAMDDGPPWDSGSRSPSIGMFVLAVDHSAVGDGFPARVAQHLKRLAALGVRLPGGRRTRQPFDPAGDISLRPDILATLRRRAGRPNGGR